MREKLKFPKRYSCLSETEKNETEGGFGFLSNLFYGLSLLFWKTPRTEYEPINATPVLLQREHGDIVEAWYGIYVYADGYEYVAEGSQPRAGIAKKLYDTGIYWRKRGR